MFPLAFAKIQSGTATEKWKWNVLDEELLASVFRHLPPLETERLLLRAARMNDAEDIYEYAKDPLVSKHVLWEAHRSVYQTRSYIRYLLRQYRNAAPGTYVIVHKASGKVIGTIGFVWVQSDNASAEVGYSLSHAYWNRAI